MSAPGKAVPKFSSFRPKAPPAEQQPSSTTLKRQRSPDPRHHSLKRHRTPDLDKEDRRHRHEDRNHDRKSHGRRQHDGHRHERDHRSRESKLAEEPLPELSHNPDLYTVDTKGDRQNVAYQRLHKYSIPPYHRIGFGNVLGLSLRFKIDREESSDDKIYLLDKVNASKDRPQRLLLKKRKPHELPALRPQDNDLLDMAQDFVAFSPHAEGRHQSVSSNEDFDSFRGIDRPRISESHTLPTDDGHHLSTDVDLEARQTNAQLHRATKTDPTNLQAWLDLAVHQQHLVRPGADAHALTNRERQTLADMRIAIFEKALRNIPATDASAQEHLILDLLEEASLAWDTQKYIQKLRDILQQHPTSFPIWSKYLVAAQANPMGFRFEDVKSFFIRCLRSVSSGTSSTQASDTRGMMLYLILRYTVFLLDTGYDELSIAIWQALCEFHFFRPDHLINAEKGTVLANFEDFWESETARFGEAGAQGWHAYSSDNLLVPEYRGSDPGSNLTSELPFATLARLEQLASHSLRFPGRTMDDCGSEDPFHVVFFSDIKEVLEATVGGFDRRDFLDALLSYLGLPPMPDTGQITSSNKDWRADVFLDHGLWQHDGKSVLDVFQGGFLVEEYQVSSDILFSRAFENITGPQKPRHGCPGELRLDENVTRFAKQILASLVRLFSNDEVLAEYYLAFELAFFPDTASKVAKSILKKRPFSIRLYNACALIEAKLGRLEKAAQIWSGAINMKNNFPIAAQHELVLLWRNWIWCDLKANQPQKALSNLASFGDSVDLQADDLAYIPRATLLRIRRALRDGFEHSLSQSQPHLASLNVELMALTTYLNELDSLQASANTVQEHCNGIMETSSTRPGARELLELLHQVKAGILAHHIQQQRPYKPAFIRSELEASIALFPNNTIFLGMYRDNEARFRIDDRVRSILKSQVLTNGQSPVVGWMFAIDQEISRYVSQSSGSTVESVRATFNRALLTIGSPVRHSRTLWTKWFEFEMEVATKEASEKRPMRKRVLGDRQPLQRLNEVFLSGLHHLPWSKDWILRGLGAFEREDGLGWDARELKRLYNVLVERELRIRVEGLEDVVDGST